MRRLLAVTLIFLIYFNFECETKPADVSTATHNANSTEPEKRGAGLTVLHLARKNCPLNTVSFGGMCCPIAKESGEHDY